MITNLAAYYFIRIDNPEILRQRLQVICQINELKGTVIVATEGINCVLAGNHQGISAFIEWLRNDPRFEDIKIKLSLSQSVPFRRLQTKIKPELITFRQSEINPCQERAPTVTPETLRQWLTTGKDNKGKQILLLDTRNQQEVAYGTFEQALTLPIDRFTDLPAVMESQRELLQDKTVVSFCTGGIRCEKSALWMRKAGYENILQLEGGILAYFEAIGEFGYRDRCFVFDERVALSPNLEPLVDMQAG